MLVRLLYTMLLALAVLIACELALAAGIDVNKEDLTGYTALTLAAKMGHHTAVQLLVNAGARTNAIRFRQKHGTAFHGAAF